MRYFLKLQYDGTDYHGWQSQPNAISVQETVEKALATIFQQEVKITGAGRTDAGVHAREMYAHFNCDSLPQKNKFLISLNRLIGKNIAINDVLPVTDEAHARFDALSREYKYYIAFEKNPFIYPYSHFMARRPDVDAMNEVALLLLGTQDFTSFSKLHTDTATNICTVEKALWEWQTDGLLVFTIKADRFLRNMVRSMVGTLLDVGLAKMNVEDFKIVIKKQNRCAAGMSMPAKGLFLENISYPQHIFIPC